MFYCKVFFLATATVTLLGYHTSFVSYNQNGEYYAKGNRMWKTYLLIFT